MWGYQADHGFHEDGIVEPLTESKKRKFEAINMEVDLPPDILRQAAWVSKHADTSDDELWRPTKVHRISAKAWLAKTDNQLRGSMTYLGWKTWQYDKDGEDWKHPHEWPSITLTIDLGSDGLSASHQLNRNYDINVWVLGDFSHMKTCSFEAVSKALGFWGLGLRIVVADQYQLRVWPLHRGYTRRANRKGGQLVLQDSTSL